MDDLLSNLEPEEQLLYLQIQKYDESQKIIKNLINNNILKEIDLYLIDDDWLNKWKEYSCLNYYNLEDIKNKPEQYLKMRKNLKEKGYKLEEFNNKNLIESDNKNISGDTPPLFKADKYFHLVTEECFESFLEGVKDKELHKIKYKFISKNKKLITKIENKVIILFEEEEKKLKLVVLILNVSIFSKLYDIIKDSYNIVQFLKNYQIDDNKEVKIIEKKENNFQILYMNKSYNNDINKDDVFFENFKKLVKSLINYDKIFEDLTNKNDNKLTTKFFYLINEKFIDNLLIRLKYRKCRRYLKDFNKCLEIMIDEYYEKLPQIDKDIGQINDNKNIFNYLQENETKNIIKYYNNYTLIKEDLWDILINLYNYDSSIKVQCFIKNNIFIIKYNDKNIEIFNIENKKVCNKLLFCFYNNQNIENIVEEILNEKSSINFVNCMNIIKTQECFKKITDDQIDSSEEIGIAINISQALKDNKFFTAINNDQFANECKFEVGLNKSFSNSKVNNEKEFDNQKKNNLNYNQINNNSDNDNIIKNKIQNNEIKEEKNEEEEENKKDKQMNKGKNIELKNVIIEQEKSIEKKEDVKKLEQLKNENELNKSEMKKIEEEIKIKIIEEYKKQNDLLIKKVEIKNKTIEEYKKRDDLLIKKDEENKKLKEEKQKLLEYNAKKDDLLNKKVNEEKKKLEEEIQKLKIESNKNKELNEQIKIIKEEKKKIELDYKSLINEIEIYKNDLLKRNVENKKLKEEQQKLLEYNAKQDNLLVKKVNEENKKLEEIQKLLVCNEKKDAELQEYKKKEEEFMKKNKEFLIIFEKEKKEKEEIVKIEKNLLKEKIKLEKELKEVKENGEKERKILEEKLIIVQEEIKKKAKDELEKQKNEYEDKIKNIIEKNKQKELDELYKMIEVEFIFNGIKTIIQYNINEKMNNIYNKYLTKIGKNINDIYFIYDGNKIEENLNDLTFNEFANNIDKNRKIMIY